MKRKIVRKRQNINAGIVRIHVIGTKRIGKVNCSCANALSTKRGNIASSCQTLNANTSN